MKLVSSQSGRNDAGTDPYGPNRNEFFVALKPYDTWPAGMRKAKLVDQISRRLRAQIPGANFSLTQPIIDNVTEAVTGSPADLAVIISGADLQRLRALADQTLARAAPDSRRRRHVPRAGSGAGAIAHPDRPAGVARYGINVRDVQDVIEMAIGGKPVSTVFEGEKRFDITVRYEEQARADADAIGNILVPTHDGGRVPLSQLAAIQVVNGASIIARRENIRQISVRTNIRGRDQGSFVKEAQEQVRRARCNLPAGYSVDWGGQFENLERARKRLTIILPITIGDHLRAAVLRVRRSAVHAGLVLVNVPFSLVGGIVFLYLRGINLSVSAAVGFISLFGVAVMSGVLYISEINRRRAEPGTTLEDAVIQGAKAQLRPSLMLILVAMLGHGPGRARHRNRQRYPASARDRCGRRPALHVVAHVARAAQPLLPDCPEGEPIMKPPVKMLLIYVDETDVYGTGPLYEAIMRRLRQLGVDGATACVRHHGIRRPSAKSIASASSASPTTSP